MASKRPSAKSGRESAEKLSPDMLQKIKRLAIAAMFSDDELLDQLVLKGGNAIDLVHQVNARASVDLDFSLVNDLDAETLGERIRGALTRTFDMEGYVAFDIKFDRRPGHQTGELDAFWGGYQAEFKLISKARATAVENNVETMRREAIQLGEGSRFLIDISRHEYTGGKQSAEVEGYRIYAYSPAMIVCEKLRAICQQMPEYEAVIERSVRRQRARDFVDIEGLVKRFKIDMGSEHAIELVTRMFEAKRVPLSYIANIAREADFHGAGFDQVRATMRPGVTLETWSYYVDFLVQECKKLEPLWHV